MRVFILLLVSFSIFGQDSRPRLKAEHLIGRTFQLEGGDYYHEPSRGRSTGR